MNTHKPSNILVWMVGKSCIITRNMHAHQVPHTEHMKRLNGKAQSAGETTPYCPLPIRSRVSDQSKPLGW